MSNNLKVLQFWVFIISDYICKLNNSLSDKDLSFQNGGTNLTIPNQRLNFW